MCHPSAKPVLLVSSHTHVFRYSAHENNFNFKLYIFSQNSIEIIYFSANRTTTFLYHEVIAVEDIYISKVHAPFQKDIVYMPYVFFEETIVVLFHKLSFWFCWNSLRMTKMQSALNKLSTAILIHIQRSWWDFFSTDLKALGLHWSTDLVDSFKTLVLLW